MLYDGFTPTLWITLTEPNGTNPVNGTDRVSKFLIDLSFTTKTHLLVFRNGDWGWNFHEHIIVMVPDQESERFEKRLPKFVPWKKWRFRDLDFQRWDSSKGHGAFVYQDNHINWNRGGKSKIPFKPYVICPRCFRKCRKDDCDYSTYGIRRIVNHTR